jgi:CRP-like cAMP-binding protein
MTTLGELNGLAQNKWDQGDHQGALKILRLILEAAPLDFGLRLRIADCLVALNQLQLADAVYLAVAVHGIKAGLPLLAMVAIKSLTADNEKKEGLIHDLATLYGKESPRLGRGVRPAPTDWSAPVRDDLDLDFSMDEAGLCHSTAQMAAYLDNITNYPERVPPVPLFAGLTATAVKRVLTVLKLRRCKAGETVVQEGEPGKEFFVIARGGVTIYRDTDEGEQTLAELGEGSILGEMAVLAAEPRVASVRTQEQTDLLVFSRRALAALADDLPQVASILERFATERMVRNLINTAPIFAPFDQEQRQNLLQRFEAHKIPPGTVVIRQKEKARGIYLILYGAVQVERTEDSGERMPLATLGGGESFGEISCVQGQPTTAEVQTVRESTIMFLPKEHFDRLVEAVPAVAEYYTDLSVQRLIENRRAAEANDVVLHDGIVRL